MSEQNDTDISISDYVFIAMVVFTGLASSALSGAWVYRMATRDAEVKQIVEHHIVVDEQACNIETGI